MKTLLPIVCLLVLSVLIGGYGYAQTKPSPLAGRWLTKDKTTIEFTSCGSGVCAKQIAAERDKDKKDNGTAIAQDVILGKDNSFTGQVIDPSNGKSYKANWDLSADGRTLTLKVKWGFMSVNETWTRLR